MKKQTLLIFCLLSALLLYIGCSKNEKQPSNLSDTSQKSTTTTKYLNSNDFKQIDIVPIDMAMTIAEKFNPQTFFASKEMYNGESAYKTSANGNNKIETYYTFTDSSGHPAFYVFNFQNNGGFVFVSGDYNIQPILAFVEQGTFKKDAVPASFIEWGNRTFENTEIVRKGLYDNSRIAHYAWRKYLNDNRIKVDNNTVQKLMPPVGEGCEESSTTVTNGPLLSTAWGQGCTFNDLCPSNNCSATSCNVPAATLTGCVATAVAQIVRYWQPANQYNYNYVSMPDTFGNIEVQRLMRDIGLPVNVDMNYGCDASGADGAKVPAALKNNFGFTSANRSSYGVADYQRVKNNIGWGFPVLLEGCSDRTNRFLGWIYTYDDCHEWVCDGASETNVVWCNEDGSWGGGVGYLYFHMNWGWQTGSGVNNFNGWFAFNNWNSGAGYNFQYAKYMVTEIHL